MLEKIDWNSLIIYLEKKMGATKQELKQIIPLYSVLTDLVLEFLEPCLDYDVPKCNHHIAFCSCGNNFEFRHPLYPLSARGKRVLVENFCPYCGNPNKHQTPDSPACLRQGWRIPFPSSPPSRDTDFCSWEPHGGIPQAKYLTCPHCTAQAESFHHTYCSGCGRRLEWNLSPPHPK